MYGRLYCILSTDLPEATNKPEAENAMQVTLAICPSKVESNS